MALNLRTKASPNRSSIERPLKRKLKAPRLLSQSEGHNRHQTCKPNSVAMLPSLTVIPLGRSLLTGSSDLPGSCGVLRAFKSAAEILRLRGIKGSLALAHRAGTHPEYCYSEFLPYLVLLRVGFAMPCALLPRRCALTAPFHPYRFIQGPSNGLRRASLLRPVQAERLSPFAYPGTAAVFSLWHFPSNWLEPAFPDVIRHTALWSSDFPLFRPRSPGKSRRSRRNSDHPARYPLSYYKMDSTHSKTLLAALYTKN